MLTVKMCNKLLLVVTLSVAFMALAVGGNSLLPKEKLQVELVAWYMGRFHLDANSGIMFPLFCLKNCHL